MLKEINVWDYDIIISEDNKLFRIEKGTWYSKELSADHYSIQSSTRNCAFRFEYFDAFGRLRDKYWGLPLIKLG